MTMRNDIFYPSQGGGMIHALRWEPAGAPVGIVQIVHGVAEYAARYDAFATFLAEQGFLVVAEDHMGHGESVGKNGVLGHFEGGWFGAVADTYQLLQDTKAEYPQLPYILLGHSMGSFMARTILAKYSDSGISAAIISGTAWMPSAVISAGLGAASMVAKCQDPNKPSKLLNDMMFGSYNNMIEHKRTTHDWLTRDQKIVDTYVADPLCGFPMTAGLARNMMMGLKFIQDPQNLSKMQKDLPVLFIAGSDDPVGNYGKGVKQAAEAFGKVGMEKVSVRLYPMGRHEMLNELNREEVYANLLDWIKKQECYA